MTMRNSAEIRFRVARPEQAAEVLSVLDEAAAWLQERGIAQWPARFEPSWVEDAIRRGETWLVAADGSVEATVTLDWSDPVWADAEGSAGYVHRMAVRRQGAGLGSVILDWAANVARRRLRRAPAGLRDVERPAARLLRGGGIRVARRCNGRRSTGPAA